MIGLVIGAAVGQCTFTGNEVAPGPSYASIRGGETIWRVPSRTASTRTACANVSACDGSAANHWTDVAWECSGRDCGDTACVATATTPDAGWSAPWPTRLHTIVLSGEDDNNQYDTLNTTGIWSMVVEDCTCHTTCPGVMLGHGGAVFPDSASLRELTVRRCSYTGVSSTYFGSTTLSTVNRLALNRNALTVIEPDALAVLTSLVVLDLADNRLTSLDAGGFPRLVVLDLSNNFYITHGEAINVTDVPSLEYGGVDNTLLDSAFRCATTTDDLVCSRREVGVSTTAAANTDAASTLGAVAIALGVTCAVALGVIAYELYRTNGDYKLLFGAM